MKRAKFVGGKTHAAIALVLLSLQPKTGSSTLVSSAPGQAVEIRSEQVVLMFDPLTQSQTTLMHLVLGPIDGPFALLIPTPSPPEIAVLRDGFFKSVGKRLRPVPSTSRSFDIRLESILAKLLTREVGDAAVLEATPDAALLARVAMVNFGGDERLMDRWLLNRGLTLSPSQADRIHRLRKMGWSMTGIYMRPKDDSNQMAIGRTPVLALTFESNEAVFSSIAPSEKSVLDSGEVENALAQQSLVEISVISEWPAILKSSTDLKPFYAERVGQGTLARWARIGRSHPWTFKRDGHMTAFQAPRDAGGGILRFGPADQYRQVRPKAQISEDRIEVNIPLELVFMIPLLAIWLWRRSRRRSQIFGRQGYKLR